MDDVWLSGGLLLLSVTLRVGWFYRIRRGPPPQQWFRQNQDRAGAVARFFYFVGLPYLGLVTGLLRPELLGLTGLSYFLLIDLSEPTWFSQLQQASTLMLVEWLLDSYLLLLGGGLAGLGVAGLGWSLTRAGVALPAFRQPILMTLYTGLHWAFYRAIGWALTGELYLGVVWGITVVLGEWLLVEWARRGRFRLTATFLVNSIVLLLTAALFFYQPNLWLLWPIQLLLVRLLSRPGRMATTQP